MKIKSTLFYITDIADDRADKKIIGHLIPISASANKNIPEPVAFQSGGLNAVEQYLKHSFPLRENYKPIIVNFKKLSVNETILPDGRVEGKIEISASFDLKTGDDLIVHFVNYTGSAHYIRKPDQAGVAEPALRQAIENAMVYFNTWIIKQADGNPLLAKEVKLVFSDYHEDMPEADTIYYSPKRPITWADFKDKVHNSKYSAAVMPGLGFTEQTSIDKGIITVRLAMKVYLPKSASWVNAGSENAYNLNHEQRHFDIVKLISERFKKKMLAEKLPVLNYDGSINVAYFDALREIDSLQKQYDNETSHGANQQAQRSWEELIDKQLVAFKN